MKKRIIYPYIPKGKIIRYVEHTNPYIILAKEYAKKYSLDTTMPGGAVIVKNEIVLGIGTNGSEYHKTHTCQRILLNCKSGEGYELCEGCHPKNHSEPSAINDALARGNNPNGADLYLWGHWWCCKSCWKAMKSTGIKNVFLQKNSEILFNKDHPDNIVGKQFAE